MRSLLLLVCVIVLSGCGSAQRRLEPVEKKFDTDGSITSLFHASLYYPQELSLRYDGYILGVEKSPRDLIMRDGDFHVRAAPDAGIADAAAAAKELNDGKMMFVSHILKTEHFSDAKPEKEGAESTVSPGRACALHNVYDKGGLPQFVGPCLNGEYKASSEVHTAFRDGWDGMVRLRDSMSRAINSGKYTHVLVITMGWNTDQVEAIRNFNSISMNLVAASDEKMKPLVVGVTWPGMWESGWADALVKLASFPNKAEDADELGLTWLGVLLHDTIPKANSKGLPVVVVGHSFGARASAVAACVGPVIWDGKENSPLRTVDTFVSLQGAFVTGSLLGEDKSGLRHPSGCPRVNNFIMTASLADRATAIPGKIPGFPHYSGDGNSYTKYCSVGQKRIRCDTVDKHGKLSVTTGNLESNILYVNADELVTENAYLSGSLSGAHSDIYRAEHGKFLYEAITRRPQQASTAATAAVQP
jgi:hypothetical protein